MIFREKLYQLRKKAGLTQGELAERLGMTASAIGMYERGKREPDIDTLILIADFFGIRTDELLGIDSSGGVHVYGNYVYDPFLKKLSLLDPSDRTKAEAYVDGLLASDKYAQKSTAV